MLILRLVNLLENLINCDAKITKKKETNKIKRIFVTYIIVFL